MRDAVLIATSALIAILVAWLGFRLALRQDERQWTRERRSDLYVDLLAEASAERDWLIHCLTEREIGERIPPIGPDDRMPSRDRRRLGGRCAAFASSEVNVRWNRAAAVGGLALLGQIEPHMAKIRADAAMDALEKQVRHELETERIPWWQRHRRPLTADDPLTRVTPSSSQ